MPRGRGERGERPHRQHATGGIGDVADADDFRAGRDRRFEGADDVRRIARRDRKRQLLEDDAAARRRQPPRLQAARMLVERQQHLVPLVEVDAVGDKAHSLGGVTRQRHFVAVRVHEGRQLLAELVLEGVLRRVRPSRVRGERAVAVDNSVVDRLRHRSERAAVHVGKLVRDQELPPHVGPELFIVRRSAPCRRLPRMGRLAPRGTGHQRGGRPGREGPNELPP